LALAGMLAADFFVSEQYSKQLWLLLALGPSLLAIAHHSGGDPRGAWNGARGVPRRRPPDLPSTRLTRT
jgi:hypothetical protein